MPELAHQGYLAQDPLAIRLVLEDVLHSLDGHFAASAFLKREGNLTIAARAQETFASVVLTDIPVLELVDAEVSAAAPAPDVGGGGLSGRLFRCTCSAGGALGTIGTVAGCVSFYHSILTAFDHCI